MGVCDIPQDWVSILWSSPIAPSLIASPTGCWWACNWNGMRGKETRNYWHEIPSPTLKVPPLPFTRISRNPIEWRTRRVRRTSRISTSTGNWDFLRSDTWCRKKEIMARLGHLVKEEEGKECLNRGRKLFFNYSSTKGVPLCHSD